MSCYEDTKKAVQQLFQEDRLNEKEILGIVEELFLKEIEMARKTGQRIDTILYEILDGVAESLEESKYPIEKILHKIFSVIVSALEESTKEEITQHHAHVKRAQTRLEDAVEREKNHLQEVFDVIETFSKERGFNHTDRGLDESYRKIKQLIKIPDAYQLPE